MPDMRIADDEAARYSAELDAWDREAWGSEPQGQRAGAVDEAAAVSRGRRLREQRADGEPGGEPPSSGWFLRHPDDYWLRFALAADIDEDCRHLIGDLEALIRPAYQRLSDLDWTSYESASASEIVCTVEIRTSKVGASRTPEKGIVTEPIQGDVDQDQLVELAMVEHQDQPFNGKLMSVIVGDRWRICANRSDGDIFVPLDGSRRLFPELA
jgi:hypothetical protein